MSGVSKEVRNMLHGSGILLESQKPSQTVVLQSCQERASNQMHNYLKLIWERITVDDHLHDQILLREEKVAKLLKHINDNLSS